MQAIQSPFSSSQSQPVTQITFIEAAAGRQAEILELVEARARFMATQPGCLAISVHRSLDGGRIVNYIQWADAAQLHAAHRAPEFRREWQRLDALAGTIEPALYEVVDVVESARR